MNWKRFWLRTSGLMLALFFTEYVALAQTPSPPFTECPATGGVTSCQVLIVINPGGTISVYADPNAGVFLDDDDTLTGILNNSNKTITSLPLTSTTDIFAFDQDGLCSSSNNNPPAGCPFGSTGYEGPTTSFSNISTDGTSGTINFSPGLAPGQSTYFSLEDQVSSQQVTVPLNTSCPANTATVGVLYSFQLVGTGGNGNYTWSLGGGSLSPLALSSSGLISGTPTSPGILSFILSITDGTGGNATQSCSIAVSSPSGSSGVSVYAQPVLTTSGIDTATNTCVVTTPPAVTSFLSTDAIVTVWFELAGLTATDSVSAHFAFNGTDQPSLVQTYTNFAPGLIYSFCSGFIPTSTAVGQWTMTIVVDSQPVPILTVPFTVSGGAIACVGTWISVTLGTVVIIQGNGNDVTGTFTGTTFFAAGSLTMTWNGSACAGTYNSGSGSGTVIIIVVTGGGGFTGAFTPSGGGAAIPVSGTSSANSGGTPGGTCVGTWTSITLGTVVIVSTGSNTVSGTFTGTTSFAAGSFTATVIGDQCGGPYTTNNGGSGTIVIIVILTSGGGSSFGGCALPASGETPIPVSATLTGGGGGGGGGTLITGKVIHYGGDDCPTFTMTATSGGGSTLTGTWQLSATGCGFANADGTWTGTINLTEASDGTLSGTISSANPANESIFTTSNCDDYANNACTASVRVLNSVHNGSNFSLLVHPQGWVSVLLLTGTVSSGSGGGGGSQTLVISGISDIWAAGLATPPALPGGGGNIPPMYKIPAGSAGKALTVTNTSGMIYNCDTTCGAGADGVPGMTDYQPAQGTTISGIQDNSKSQFLVGVFLNGQQPHSAPIAADYSATYNTVSFSPQLGQLVAVGNGLTSTGLVKQFIIPPGATQFYLGNMDGYSPNPGYFGDDTGAITATVQIGTPSGAGLGSQTGSCSSAPEPASLLGCWQFEGNGADGSGNGRDLTLEGNATFGPGIKGQALALPGDATSFADRTINDAVFDFNGDFTIQAWFNTSSSANQIIIAKPGVTLGGGGWVLGIFSGQLQFIGGDGTSVQASYTAGKWNQVAVTLQGQVETLYVNGSQQSSNNGTLAFGSTPNPLRVGANLADVGTTQTFNGTIDQVAIWNKALTPGEISGLNSSNGALGSGTGGGGNGGGGNGGAGNPPATTSGNGCSYNVQDPGLTAVPASGLAQNFATINAPPGCQFAAYSPVGWAHVTPQTLTDVDPGTGQAAWTYQIDPQPAAGAQRSTFLTVAGQQIAVTQVANITSCGLALSSTSSAPFSYKGTTSDSPGSVSLTITGGACTAQVGVDPNVPVDKQFAYVISSTLFSASGTKTIYYALEPNNTTSARSINMLVTGSNPPVTLTYTINQQAGPSNTSPPPTINSGGGITNAASFIHHGPIAQGAFFSIFGSNLGPPNPGAKANSYPLQPTLAGVSVSVSDGKGNTVQALPVFAAQFQINAIMPSNAPLGKVQMTPMYNGVAGPPQTATIVASAFGAFAVSAGHGPGIVQNALPDGTRPLNTATATAGPNTYVVLWGTGLGPISASLTCPGAAVPDQCDPTTSFKPQVSSIQVSVGGVKVNMQDQYAYAARAPHIAGVDQVQFPLPSNVPLGCYVPVQLSVNGNIYSNTVTMAINTTGQPCSDYAPVGAFARDGGKNASVVLGRFQVSDLNSPQYSGEIDVAYAEMVQQPAGGSLGFDALLSPLPLGTCTYYNNVNFGGLFAGQLPLPAGSQTLDAGPAIMVQGPNGSQSLSPNTPKSPYVGLFGASGALAAFISKPPFLNPGAYIISGTGGKDVGAFSFAPLTIGAPAVLQTQVTTIDRSAPLDLSWTGGDPGQAIYISGYSNDPDTNTSGQFECLAPMGAGSFRVPAGMFANLPTTLTASGKAAGTFIFATVPLGDDYSSISTNSAPTLDHGAAWYYVGSVISHVNFK